MWLINTTSLKLEAFLDPPSENIHYAILSHTWGADEVSFQDIANLDIARTKVGFSKITKVCEISKAHGYTYVWVDTCCINKESSAELSEAINSMYAWYQAADICYTYLSDLDQPAFKGLPDGFEQLKPSQLIAYKDKVLNTPFAKCRWFTRGWTLQELLAQYDVQFYDSSWTSIGDKYILQGIISCICKIEVDVLIDSTKIALQSVWHRMSWAQNRHTSRTEDIAYCLLGIFDINMPLIYGEGHKAFQRLQEEITKKENDPSILVWSARDMPWPQYRPPLYRRATQPPLYRGAFAWSPHEFLTEEMYAKTLNNPPRRASQAAHIALPMQVEMSQQSSCLVQRGNIDILMYRERPESQLIQGAFLEIQTPGGFVYRLVEKVSGGLVFKDFRLTTLKAIPTQPNVDYADLRIVSEGKAMLMESVDANLDLRIGIKEANGIVSRRLAWPQQRWEPWQRQWTYTKSEISRLPGSGPTILGIQRLACTLNFLDIHIGVELANFALVCIVGVKTIEDQVSGGSQTGLFAGCFVENSRLEHVQLEDWTETNKELSTAKVANIHSELVHDLDSYESGRSEIFPLRSMHTRIRVTCTYPKNPCLEGHCSVWNATITMEYEDGTESGNWVTIEGHSFIEKS